MASVLSKRQQARNERALQELIKSVPGNDRCADCQTRNPGWASWSLGIFLCMRCAALHRKLGTHISKVKSLSMDSWTNEQVENMKRNGNAVSNRLFNPHNIRSPVPLDIDEVDSAMERFIRQKYEQRIFQPGNARPSVRQNTGSTSSDDQPPPLPPKTGKHFFSSGLRSASSTFPSPNPPTPYNRGGSPSRENKASRIFGASIASSDASSATGESFESKLAKLRDMGFPDDKRNSTILKAVSGDIEKAVEALIRLGETDGGGRSGTPVAANGGRNGLTPGRSLPVNTNNPFDLRSSRSQEALRPSPAAAQQAQVSGEYITSPSQSQMSAQNPFISYAGQQDPQQQFQQSFQNLHVSQPLFPNATGGYPQQQQHQQLQYQQAQTPPVPQIPQQHNYFIQTQSQSQQQQPVVGGYNPFFTQPAQNTIPSPTNPYSNSALPSTGGTFQYIQPQQQLQEQYGLQAQQLSTYQQPQPLVQQQTRAPNSSILALFNYPQLAPTPPTGGPNTATESPQGPEGSAHPDPSLPQWASTAQGKRSASTPIGPSSGSRNPFLSGSGGGGVSPTGRREDVQVNGGSRHVSQESVDATGWQSGRHSPDAFANLSSRF
ncbi:hypothetical protein FGG08_003879 [Glutinoglossum americanum]|uniref:UBA domain-containing protein 3 n=1 Tax=Glutinoglossum americanum TaxID=1670608 RepID=A0A9P8I1K6_9PEZI|nr:hypothetical protein FGG08_003879 [Glutinoglossum americanum]